jgi:hypothetical protein
MESPAMSWPEQIHENTLMTAPSEEEFSNYLDFNMPFNDLEHGPGNMQHSQSQPTTTAPDSMAHLRPNAMHYSGQMEGLAMDFGGQESAQSHPQGQLPYSTPNMTPGFCAQEPSPMSHPNHYMQNQTMIPPTPNSIEMHGNAARYSRVDATPDLYDGYSRINEEQVSATEAAAGIQFLILTSPRLSTPLSFHQP